MHDGDGSVIEIASCLSCEGKLPPIGDQDIFDLPGEEEERKRRRKAALTGCYFAFRGWCPFLGECREAGADHVNVGLGMGLIVVGQGMQCS